MKIKFIYALIALALALVTGGIAQAQTGTNHFRAVVLAERGDQHEPFVAAALEWLKATATNENFSIDVLANPDRCISSVWGPQVACRSGEPHGAMGALRPRYTQARSASHGAREPQGRWSMGVAPR